jgi:hypothetical protein
MYNDNMVHTTKDAAAVALGRRGGRIGGPARAASLTRERRTAIARQAVQARWAKVKSRDGSGTTKPLAGRSKKALHLCLKRIKAAKTEAEVRRLTQELQKIVFHKQYQNAED